jgi:histidyl-tRNA synthetase
LYNAPQRLWYTGPMFRHERPQKGRYRQFHQVGVEAMGYAGPDIDVEMIVMCARLWRKLGIRDVALQLNTLGDLPARQRHREKLIAYFERHKDALDAEAARRLHSNPLRILDSKNPAMQQMIVEAPRLLDELDEEALEHFAAVQAVLQRHEIAYEINPRLVRGLDYYNRTVFEWVTTRLGAQGTICAGGRYDGLLAQLGGKPQPACGFAIGIERLLALLQEDGMALPPVDLDVYLVHQGEAAYALATKVADQLRDAGLKVALHCGGGSFKSQMKKADGSGAMCAVIIGDDEVAANRVALKPLRGGEQMDVPVAELARHVHMLRA